MKLLLRGSFGTTRWWVPECAHTENLPAGVLLDIHVAAEGFLPGQQQVTLTAGQNTHIWEFFIFEPSNVRGTIVDTEGAPIARATVNVYDANSGGLLGRASAYSAGAFVVNDLMPGTGRVRGSAPHYLRNWANSEGQLTWDLSTGSQLPPGGVLDDASPTPVAHLVLAREAVLVSASKPGWKTQWAGSVSRTRYGAMGYWLDPGDVVDITGQNSHTFDLKRR